MQMSLDSRFLTIPDGVLPLTELGSHCWTNENGMRAWILSAEDWADLKMRLPFDLQAAKATEARINAVIGDSSYAMVGTVSLSQDGRSDRINRVHSFAKVTGDHFNLVLMASTEELISLSDGTYGGRQTNLAPNFRVMLPNGGAVVVDGRTPGDKPGTNFWFITSVVAIDPTGKAKKLGK